MDREQLIEEVANAIWKMRVSRKRKRSGESDSGRGMVLNYLYEHQGQASPGDLRDYMQVTTPRVTAVLNELEEDRLIDRLGTEDAEALLRICRVVEELGDT